MSGTKVIEVFDLWASNSWDELEDELAEVSSAARAQYDGMRKVVPLLLHGSVAEPIKQEPKDQVTLASTGLSEFKLLHKDQITLGGLHHDPLQYGRRCESIGDHDSAHEWNKVYWDQCHLSKHIIHPGVFYETHTEWKHQVLSGICQDYFKQGNAPPLVMPNLGLVCNGSHGLPGINLVTIFDFWLDDPLDPCDISGPWERLTITAAGEMKLSDLFENYFSKSDSYSSNRQRNAPESGNFTQIISLDGKIQYEEVQNYAAVKQAGTMVQDTDWYAGQRVVLVGGDRLQAFANTYNSLKTS